MAELGETPIIIIKKKGHHGGHHGGAWKVAYADFVTAMMALFIVLWLMNSSKKVQEAVGGYFRDPSGKGKLSGNGVAGAGQGLTATKTDMAELKEKIEKAISEMPEIARIKDHVKLTVTGEGLRIELIETDKGMFFESGNAHPTTNAEELLRMIAAELGKLPNRISIEGHTDSKPYTGQAQYTNWELASDRANAARRMMQTSGLRENQVAQVRGYADQMLRNKDKPEDASNRRVSVIVQYQEADIESAVADVSGGEAASEHGAAASHGGGHGEAKPIQPQGGHGESKPEAAQGGSHAPPAAKPAAGGQEHGNAKPSPAGPAHPPAAPAKAQATQPVQAAPVAHSPAAAKPPATAAAKPASPPAVKPPATPAAKPAAAPPKPAPAAAAKKAAH